MSGDTAAMLRAAAKALLGENQGWDSPCKAFGRALQAAAEAGPPELVGYITEPIHYNEVGAYSSNQPVAGTVYPDTNPEAMLTKRPPKPYDLPAFGEDTGDPVDPNLMSGKAFFWPAKPDLPSVIFHQISNSTKDGNYVEFTTMYAREYLLLEYAEEVRKVAYALVDEANAARCKAENDNLAKNKRLDAAEAEARRWQAEARASYAFNAEAENRGREAEEKDRPAYEQAARQQGIGIAMDVLARRADEYKKGLGNPNEEVVLRRAWEEILVLWREAKAPKAEGGLEERAKFLDHEKACEERGRKQGRSDKAVECAAFLRAAADDCPNNEASQHAAWHLRRCADAMEHGMLKS